MEPENVGINFYCDRQLKEQFDKVIKDLHYSNASEAYRDMMRNMIKTHAASATPSTDGIKSG